MMLDESLLNEFMHTFYGYGSYAGHYWFIGMEEGGGNSFDEISNRLHIWRNSGKPELLDAADYHLKLKIPHFFTEPVRLQRTWSQLIRVYLSAEGHASTTDDLKRFQKNRLGRLDQDTCLMELLPLPSPGLQTWHFNRWSANPFLRDREAYRRYCLPWRSANLWSQIETHQPPVVVFYGTSYREWWQRTAGSEVIFQEHSGVWLAKPNRTLFVIIQHPAAKGITNAFFEKAGQLISTYLR